MEPGSRWPLATTCAALISAAWGCKGYMGSLTPVPPIHRLPPDVGRAVILVDRDPVIETRDPNHVVRANEQNVPRDYRASMEASLGLAGFVVTRDPASAHDLRARLALAVTEEGMETFRQVYRCGLEDPDGKPVAQVDWVWPQGQYVGPYEVYDFATHHLATEVATSRPVLAYLRSRRGARDAATTP